MISPGGANEETNTVTGVGSLLLAKPLFFDHAAGEPVAKIADAESLAPPGDTDCDREIDIFDALHLIRGMAGAATSAGCLYVAGDANCSGALDGGDPLAILRHVAGLPPAQAAGCPAVGD